MANLIRVLIVEDSEDDTQLILRQLRSVGYDPQWERVDTPDAMASSLHREQWDVILCDYKMPRFSAPAALKLVQEREIDIPFIVVSGTIGEETAVTMMKSGAHDYLIKDKLARLVVAIEREMLEAKTRHEKKKAEEDLQHSEQNFKAISENAYDGITVALRNGAYIYANRRASEITGYHINEILKAGIEEFARPDESLKLSERRKKILAGENVPHQYETVIIHKNGDAVPIDITSARTQWYGQNADILVFRDITERKRAEEALLLKNRMLMSINNYIQAIAFVPQDGMFTTIVTKLKEITGAAEVIINGYDEQKSELVCLQSTLSEERNTWFRKTLGGNLVGYRTPVSKERYEEMTSSAIGRVGSIHEVTFGAIPAPVGKLIEKMFGFGWFVGLALKHNERLEGTIMIAGKPETAPPENEELVTYATAIANVMVRRKAEEALRESEENFRRSLSDSPLGIRIVSAEGKLLYANQAILDIHGYDSVEERRTTPHKEIYIPQSYAEHLVRKEQRQRGEYVASNYEICIIRKDGEIRHLDVFRKEVLWNGEPQFQVIYNDITERKRAEEALRESEEKIRGIFESIGDAVTVTDLEGKIIDINEASVSLWGYAGKEELIGRKSNDFVAEEYRSSVIQDTEEVLAEGRAKGAVEFNFIRKDGSIFSGEARAAFLRDKSGEPAGFISVVRDITERQRAEEALQHERIMLERTEGISHIGSWEWDVATDTVTWSDELFRIFQRDPREGAPSFAEHPAFYHPDDMALLLQAAAAAVAGGTPYELELRAIRKDGETRVCVARGVPEMGTDGHAVRLFGSLQDITERKRAEDELASYREHLEELVRDRTAELDQAKVAAEVASRSKTRFLSSMSHEIRTPLNAILGFSELLIRDKELTTKQRERMETVNRSGEHLLGLINDILEISKIEAGKSVIIPAPFDLIATLRNIESMFLSKIDAKRLSFRMETAGVTARYIVCDEAKIRQILINLVGNAVKFTDEGDITLRVRTVDGDGGDMVLTTEVEDTGPGMSETEMAGLFTVFEQGSAGAKAGGTGLGLAISRQFAQLMGGDITVRSEKGKGSCFTLRIAARAGEPPADKAKSVSRTVRGLVPGQGPFRVLVADDQPDNRMLIREFLVPAGFEVMEACDGIETIDMFKSWSPHLILMDKRMPRMNGYEAMLRIKEIDPGGATKIVAVTASAFSEDRTKAIDRGADAYLPKPFKAHELFECVGSLLGVRYVYEEETPVSATPARPLTPESLDGLPDGLIEKMLAATVALDRDGLIGLIGEIAANEPETGRQLSDMVKNYQYEALITLLKRRFERK